MFHSSKTGELTSLDDYVSRMKEGQSQIYYLAGETKEVVESSPLLERLIKRGYEVLYMTDPIDEYALANLEKYDGKYKITNIGREGLKLDDDKDDEEKEKQLEQQYAQLTSFLKKSLGSKVEKVKISHRLTQSPSALVSSAHGYTANMERIIKAQALSDPKATYVKLFVDLN
jgi:molecular chaperone HtpG